MDLVAQQLQNMYHKATLNNRFKSELVTASQKIKHNLSEYEVVNKEMGSAIPSWLVGCLHYREQASLSLGAFLGNGQMIIGTGRRSTLVPIGAGPFATFAEGAIYALRRVGLQHVQSWELGTCLEEAERWNGLGYRRRGVVNPYLFSGTSVYHAGKFIADGHYSPSAVDMQPGIAALVMQLVHDGIAKV